MSGHHNPTERFRKAETTYDCSSPHAERLIFHNPARNLKVGKVPGHLPVPIPGDRLAGLLNRTDSPLACLVVVLASVHALHVTTIRRIFLADLDMTRGRLVVQRRNGPHTVYLDQLTYQLASTGCASADAAGPPSPTGTC